MSFTSCLSKPPARLRIKGLRHPTVILDKFIVFSIIPVPTRDPGCGQPANRRPPRMPASPFLPTAAYESRRVRSPGAGDARTPARQHPGRVTATARIRPTRIGIWFAVTSAQAARGQPIVCQPFMCR